MDNKETDKSQMNGSMKDMNTRWMDIYYSGVDILRELSPEEMEEAFQKRLAGQSQGKEIPA